ncbi:MAG: DUF4013 domain-containing protein [Anaerolineales bacterium]|jgi:hypothetical protein|nr:DUF4013 domain-containing protein [Anaerolineales bacterium]
MSNIGELLTFPFETVEARKNFLLGCLLTLAGLFVPVLPHLVVYGYIARMVRKIAEGESPSMPAWDNLNDLFIDGLRLWGVKLVISLPLIVTLLAGMGSYTIGIIFIIIQDDPNLTGVFLPILLLIFGATLCIAFPLGIASVIIAYPAAIHAVARQNFSAGFKFREWGSILRVNFGGFLLATLLTYAISLIYSIVLQILMWTVILICLLPLLVPLVGFYMMLMPEVLAAQAYREGQLKLANPLTTSEA